jgi:hypothetical protein
VVRDCDLNRAEVLVMTHHLGTYTFNMLSHILWDSVVFLRCSYNCS